MAIVRRLCCVLFLLFCQILLAKSGVLKPTTGSKGKSQGGGDSFDQVPRVVPKVSKEGLNYKLRNDERCKEDIADYCSKEAKSGGNYDLLICLQSKIKDDELSEDCHQTLWEYKHMLVHDRKFEAPAIALCKKDLEKLEDCKTLKPEAGDIVPCLVDHRDQISNGRCRHVVNKLSQILFTDYRLLKNFYKDCKDDVLKFGCGTIDVPEKDDIHTQGSTIECLEDNEANLTDSCRLRIIRVAELQSEDYHLNRPLYFACREDRERFCASVEAGEGKVYACLMKHKFDTKMSEECRSKLTTKQKIESKDYKANFPFLESCKEAIERHKCSPKGDSPAALAKVLLCLEMAINDGEKVSGKCEAHMKDIQEDLMEDYSINPAVVAHCETEINKYCGKVEKGGKTLDCLMEKAMEKEEPNSEVEFGHECYEAVSSLLKETGAGGDFKVDATLRAACRLPAAKLCPSAKNDMSALSCLMENLNHKDMGVDCQEQLMHLQFFLARDFKLDEVLYRACKHDAQELCESKMGNTGKDDNAPETMILACLYRHTLPHMNPDPQKKVSKACAAEVMRTMHERAADVKLMPQIQMSCVKDLAKHCTNNVEPGEEIECLQDKYEKLEYKCKKSMEEFTEEESEDIDLDKSLINHCSKMVKEFCEDHLKNNDAESILPCLYKHKYEKKMDLKCRAELEHRELIELKDYRFSVKFKQACKKDVAEHCSHVKKKPDVIECLSSRVREAVVSTKEHTISPICRSQLKAEKLRQVEDIKFDPKLYGACSNDAQTLCSHENEDGPAAILECLKRKENDLSEGCKKQIFEREKQEAVDSELDVRLFRVCRAMIKKFCDGVRPEKVLGCLKKHRREMETDEKCKELVFYRQKIALKDLDLNPELREACKKDLSKHCHSITNNVQAIPCLKKNIKELSDKCEAYIVELEEEAALDYRLNPSLAEACEEPIATLCGDKEPGEGDVMECLKDNFKKIRNEKCRAEIKEALVEERTDIMADPVLHEACASMVTKYCDGIHHGRGRILQCLLQVLEDGKIRQKECRTVLKSRKQMWISFQIPAGPESLTDLASAVSNSPQRNYFFIVFSCVLAIIFIGGLISGRLSKRVAREAKNR